MSDKRNDVTEKHIYLSISKNLNTLKYATKVIDNIVEIHKNIEKQINYNKEEDASIYLAILNQLYINHDIVREKIRTLSEKVKDLLVSYEYNNTNILESLYSYEKEEISSYDSIVTLLRNRIASIAELVYSLDNPEENCTYIEKESHNKEYCHDIGIIRTLAETIEKARTYEKDFYNMVNNTILEGIYSLYKELDAAINEDIFEIIIVG